MIHAIDNPVGIDKAIYRIQKRLHDKLGWNVSANGRVYLIDDKPVLYYKKGDYKPVLFLEKYDAKFFFVENGTTSGSGGDYETDIDLILLANTSKIYPNILHHADEEVKQAFLDVLRDSHSRGEIEIETGANALKGFETKLDKRLHPYSFYKFSFKIKYNTNEC